jgi:hypothetical protein
MHFGFILKTKDPVTGELGFWACQMQGTTRAECEKRLQEKFKLTNVYAPGYAGEVMHTLEAILTGGECEDGWENSSTLYEKACNKAAKLKKESSGKAG